jgi:hypothetical protein
VIGLLLAAFVVGFLCGAVVLLLVLRAGMEDR